MYFTGSNREGHTVVSDHNCDLLCLSAGTILLQLGRDILLAGLFIAAGVTLLFAVWEYLEHKFRYSER